MTREIKASVSPGKTARGGQQLQWQSEGDWTPHSNVVSTETCWQLVLFLLLLLVFYTFWENPAAHTGIRRSETSKHYMQEEKINPCSFWNSLRNESHEVNEKVLVAPFSVWSLHCDFRCTNTFPLLLGLTKLQFFDNMCVFNSNFPTWNINFVY